MSDGACEGVPEIVLQSLAGLAKGRALNKAALLWGR